MKYWLVKSEPEVYSWDDLVREGKTMWEGVRNYGARNNLRDMKKGDHVLFYHSHDKEIVGLSRVTREHYPDPTADDKKWVVVDIEPLKPLVKKISLEAIKKDQRLAEIKLIRQSRLSVMPLTVKEYGVLLEKGEISGQETASN